MDKRFSQRRFSDEEMSRILDEATRAESSAASSTEVPEGHTLDEIREIAREAGIDPAGVDRAAAHLVAAPSEASPLAGRDWGVSRVVHEERTIPRPLSGGEMSSLPQLIEVVLNRSGKARAWGDWVEWRDNQNRLYLGVVRGQGQTRVRVIADSFHDMMPVFAAIGFVSLFTIGALESVPLILPIVVIAVLAAQRLWRRHCTKTRRIVNDLLDILEDRLEASRGDQLR